MRLIDADELKEWITGHCDIELDEATEGEILRVIDDQPTAYDVDKVVEQFKKERKFWLNRNIVPAINLDKAISIVKGGGQG